MNSSRNRNIALIPLTSRRQHAACMSSFEAPLVGVIHDTTSRGHFDVAVYVGGLLLMRVGSGAAAQLPSRSRAEILEVDSENEFIPRDSIRRLVLQKRR